VTGGWRAAVPRDVRSALVLLALAAGVLLVYREVGDHAFLVVYDDEEYVTRNAWVRAGLTWGGAAWAFTETHAANWHPLTFLSHMLDVELFGMDAGWHHRVNVAIHLANSALLYRVLLGMTGALWRSAFVAALFALHPLHVESVAWVAERKDVLSGLFWMLSMGCYAGYARRGGAGRYLLVAACLALGLMAKPMVVTLPFVLLLLDYWPLRRTAWLPPDGGGEPVPPRRLLLEKVPLLLLSAASCVVTYLAQSAWEAKAAYSAEDRLANALVSYVRYLGKTFWPEALSIFYPHPADIGAGVPWWQAGGALLILSSVSVAAVRWIRSRPYIAVGWSWFLGTLVPVIGLVPVGAAAMADRYTYLPLVGVFLGLTWAVSEAFPGGRFRGAILGAAGGLVLLLLAVLAGRQTSYWKDSETLFRHASVVVPGNWVAYNNLGVAVSKAGRNDEAIRNFREAVRFNPNYFEAHANLGVALLRKGSIEEGKFHLYQAYRLKPRDPMLGTLLQSLH
jgi:hypothetical protein